MSQDHDTGLAWLSNGLGLVPTSAISLISPEERLSQDTHEMPQEPVFSEMSKSGALEKHLSGSEMHVESAAIHTCKAFFRLMGQLCVGKKKKKKKHTEILKFVKPKQEGEEDAAAPAAEEISKSAAFKEGMAVGLTHDESLLEQSVKSSGLPWPLRLDSKPWTHLLREEGTVVKASETGVILISVGNGGALASVPAAALVVPDKAFAPRWGGPLR